MSGNGYSVKLVSLNCSVIEIILNDWNEFVAVPSFPTSELAEELLGTDDCFNELSEERLRPPTTPTSRPMAPTAPDDLESGEGTWTGSVEEEYTPTAELADATGFWWVLLGLTGCDCSAVSGVTPFFSSDKPRLSMALETASSEFLVWDSEGPFGTWDDFLSTEDFWFLTSANELQQI